MSYIEGICMCKSMSNRRRLHTRKGKTSMVSTLVVSSKGMYLRVWMLFTSVFTCICYRMYIHKINVACHKHTWWVKEANGVYLNPKIYRILNALKFKYFEVLEKISDFKRFIRVKEFSKLS